MGLDDQSLRALGQMPRVDADLAWAVRARNPVCEGALGQGERALTPMKALCLARCVGVGCTNAYVVARDIPERLSSGDPFPAGERRVPDDRRRWRDDVGD